jgi:hypothetical protein
MSILADQGVELAIPPDGPVVRMVEQDIVRIGVLHPDTG